MLKEQSCYDLVVIGAGPSGAVVSALVKQQGYRVLVLEKQHFPRFSIGESLLPQCMTFLEQAGMLDAVQAAGFQFKNGAAFNRAECYDQFDFTEKFSPGWGTTFQVQRARFDKLLADEAERQGVEIRYGHEVLEFQPGSRQLTVQDEAGQRYQLEGRMVLDASGFGRVLPRLLELDQPSSFPARQSLFCHIEDNIDHPDFDRDKILITVHPEHQDIWYWLIPFQDGRASIGVVARPEFLAQYDLPAQQLLPQMVSEAPQLNKLLENARWDTEVGTIHGYACDVSQLHGDGYALLGNAGEFLDPVFSSGVTIALKSSSLAAPLVIRELEGESPDWEAEFAVPLRQGVDTFRAFVEGWYDGRLQDVIFSAEKSTEVKKMISSILAGYAWDTDNPFVRDPGRLTTLAELCRNA